MSRFLILVFVFALSTRQSFSQQPDAHLNYQLSLSIDAKVLKIVPYEPVRLIISLRNKSLTTAMVPLNIFSNLQLLVTHGNMHLPPVLDRSEFRTVYATTPPPIPLEPGVVLKHSTILFMDDYDNKRFFVFPSRGSYLIKAHITSDTGLKVESPEVKVVVEEPSIEDRKAAKLIMNPSAAANIQEWGYVERGIAPLKEIAALYGRSHFADFARYTLGDYYASKYYSHTKTAPQLDLKSFNYYSAISDRIPPVKVAALLSQAELIVASPDLRLKVDIPKFVNQLESKTVDAKTIGVQFRLAELIEKLKNIKNLQPKNPNRRLPK